jgi:hypothetical protein
MRKFHLAPDELAETFISFLLVTSSFESVRLFRPEANAAVLEIFLNEIELTYDIEKSSLIRLPSM